MRIAFWYKDQGIRQTILINIMWKKKSSPEDMHATNESKSECTLDWTKESLNSLILSAKRLDSIRYSLRPGV
jgi:hypothetical protein